MPPAFNLSQDQTLHLSIVARPGEPDRLRFDEQSACTPAPKRGWVSRSEDRLPLRLDNGDWKHPFAGIEFSVTRMLHDQGCDPPAGGFSPRARPVKGERSATSSRRSYITQLFTFQRAEGLPPALERSVKRTRSLDDKPVDERCRSTTRKGMIPRPPCRSRPASPNSVPLEGATRLANCASRCQA